MGEPPVPLGIVVMQYLDHLGIREPVQIHGIEASQAAEVANESADRVNGDLVLTET